MTKKYEILLEFIKDISSETKDIETYLFVREYISKYQLTIDITTQPTKNKLIEVNTTLKFEDKEKKEKKSYFEIIYTTLVKIIKDIDDKKELQKILLCDVQKEIQQNIEKTFTSLINSSGYKNVKVNNIDFEKLYNNKFS
tara:strand:- start:760 stop:1179 length:420 start_codon:yes stop_codon:yes gene_type:complete